MRSELVEKLALIFVQANATANTTPAQIYDLYKKAEREIRVAERDSCNPTL